MRPVPSRLHPNGGSRSVTRSAPRRTIGSASTNKIPQVRKLRCGSTVVSKHRCSSWHRRRLICSSPASSLEQTLWTRRSRPQRVQMPQKRWHWILRAWILSETWGWGGDLGLASATNSAGGLDLTGDDIFGSVTGAGDFNTDLDFSSWDFK